MLLRLNKIQNELFSDSVEDSLYSSTLPLVLYLEFLYDLQNISPIEHVWATTFVNSKELVSSTLLKTNKNLAQNWNVVCCIILLPFLAWKRCPTLLMFCKFLLFLAEAYFGLLSNIRDPAFAKVIKSFPLLYPLKTRGFLSLSGVQKWIAI